MSRERKKRKRSVDDDDDDGIGGREVWMGLNTITPCAACKLLRRRCGQECPFSPYFSPHQPHKFASVHKVFGASNVSKMLMEVAEAQRADTANSLVYEANVRLRDPVYGCMGAISTLHHQLHSLQGELNAVRSELLKYKYINEQQEEEEEEEANNNNINIASSHHPHHVSVATASPPITTAPVYTSISNNNDNASYFG